MNKLQLHITPITTHDTAKCRHSQNAGIHRVVIGSPVTYKLELRKTISVQQHQCRASPEAENQES